MKKSTNRTIREVKFVCLGFIIGLFFLLAQPDSVFAGMPVEADPPQPPVPTTWVAGKTSVSDLTAEQQAKLCGVPLEKLPEIRERAQETAPAMIAPSYGYPASIDWRDVAGQDWTTPIRNQRACGSCVAFGVIGSIESRMEIAEDNALLSPDLSEAHLFFCGCGNCCEPGWYPYAALEFAQETGIVDEACSPYDLSNQTCSPCSNWQDRVTKISYFLGLADDQQTKQVTANQGPVVACMSVYEDFFSYVSGIYRHEYGEAVAGHCVTLVGYNDVEEYWIAKNSWGAGWGENGWFRIAYGEAFYGTEFPIMGCNDMNEPNDQLYSATEITYGSRLHADHCHAGDVDYYIFMGERGDQISARTEALSLGSPFLAEVKLYDSDGVSVLAEVEASADADPTLVYTLGQTGQYYLSVTNANLPDAYGPEYFYTLLLQLAPDIVVEWPEMPVSVELGSSQTVNFTIRNEGVGDLEVMALAMGGVFEPSQTIPSSVHLLTGQGHSQVLSKESVGQSVEPATGESSVAAEVDGGLATARAPDPFGYTVRDSYAEYGPSYRWLEIAPPAGGHGLEIAELTGVDDGHYWPLNLPFPFPFYGQMKEQMAIASNGTLYFEDEYLSFASEPMPSRQSVDEFIAHFWDDLVIDPGAIYVQDFGTMLVIEYYDVSGYNCEDSGSWEIILFDTGSILLQFQDTRFGCWHSLGENATVGIQANHETGLQYAYHEPKLVEHLAVCFAYPGQASSCWNGDWINYSADPVVIAGGQSVMLEMRLDTGVASVEQPGAYHATLLLESNDPDTPLLQLPIEMKVPPPATWGKLEGKIQSLGYCDAQPSPLPGAEVILAGSQDAWWLMSSAQEGEFALWLDPAHNPLTLMALAPGHTTAEATDITVHSGQASEMTVDLRSFQPCVTIGPTEAIEVSIRIGESAQHTLSMENRGAAPAEFFIFEREPSEQMSPVQSGTARILETDKVVGKPTPGSQPASEMTAASTGGPDPFGYRYWDSNEAAGPTYAWIEIAPPAGGEGTELSELNEVDDGYYWSLTLPFAFPFYDNSYTEIAVASNGAIYFEDTYLGLDKHPLPGSSSETVERLIAPFWDDLVISPGSVYYNQFGQDFLVEFYEVTEFEDWGGNSATWQIILKPSGCILLQYKDAATGGDQNGVIGIQNDSVTGLQFGLTSDLEDDLAICFAYPGCPSDCEAFADIPWISTDPISGVVSAGDAVEIAVTLSADPALVSASGTYDGELIVVTDDAGQSLTDLTVTMHVFDYQDYYLPLIKHEP